RRYLLVPDRHSRIDVNRISAFSPLCAGGPMNSPLTDPAEFASLLRSYFLDRLLRQQAVSATTLSSYRDTFRLLLAYAQTECAIQPASMTLEDFDAKLTLGFLDYL